MKNWEEELEIKRSRVNKAEKLLRKVETKVTFLRGAIHECAYEFVRCWCWANDLSPPCYVEINFDNGKEIAYFAQIDKGWDHLIVIHELNKQNRPKKTSTSYEWHYIELMTKVPKPAKPVRSGGGANRTASPQTPS